MCDRAKMSSVAQGRGKAAKQKRKKHRALAKKVVKSRHQFSTPND